MLKNAGNNLKNFKSIKTLTAFCMLVFILVFPEDVIDSAKGGLLIWFNNVIPSIFPFIFLSDIIIKNVGLNETRTGIIDVLKAMGADIEISGKKNVCGEDIGDIHVRYAQLHGTTVEGEIIPRLIDEIPIIAVAASTASGKTIIKDAHELRVKESDRIKTIIEMLSLAGVKTEELEDGLIVYGNSRINGATYFAHGDHRIAMSAKILSLLTEEKSEITDYECVNVSFPDFQKKLEELLS